MKVGKHEDRLIKYIDDLTNFKLDQEKDRLDKTKFQKKEY